jgi:hypothetical protein
MPDGTLFFPKVLKDSPATPNDPITATRLGSYWNLSIGTTLKSGIIDPRSDTMRRTVDYMLLHGARLLGLTRINYYPVPVGSHRAGGLPRYSTSGADNVYGPGILDALAELDELLDPLLILAEKEKSLELLAAEMERTRRRVNALEFVLIPSIEETVKFIYLKLGEVERGDQTRLMRVKEIIRGEAG